MQSIPQTLNHWNGNSIEWWNTSGSKVVDWDGDGKVEILVSSNNFERIEKVKEIFLIDVYLV